MQLKSLDGVLRTIRITGLSITHGTVIGAIMEHSKSYEVSMSVALRAKLSAFMSNRKCSSEALFFNFNKLYTDKTRTQLFYRVLTFLVTGTSEAYSTELKKYKIKKN